MQLHWVYEPLIAETITWFVNRAIPDPGEDWQEGCYEIYDAVPDGSHGKAWLVTYDIPTVEPSLGVWLHFVIDKEPDRDVIVRDIHAVRGGRGKHKYDTYEWIDDEDTWELASEDEED